MNLFKFKLFILFLLLYSTTACATLIKSSTQDVKFDGKKDISLVFSDGQTIKLDNGSLVAKVKRTKYSKPMIKCSASEPAKQITLENSYSSTFFYGNFVIFIITVSSLLYLTTVPYTLFLAPFLILPWSHGIDLVTEKAYQYQDEIDLSIYCK